IRTKSILISLKTFSPLKIPKTESQRATKNSTTESAIRRRIDGNWSATMENKPKNEEYFHKSPGPMLAPQKWLSARLAPPVYMFDHELPSLSNPSACCSSFPSTAFAQAGLNMVSTRLLARSRKLNAGTAHLTP